MTRRILCGLLLILLPLMLISYYLPQACCNLLLPKVTLTRPTVLNTRDRIPLSGTVTAAQSAVLTAELPYAISTVYVSVGDTVTVGEPVARIDQKRTLSALKELLTLTEDYTALTALLPKGVSDLSEFKRNMPTALFAPASGTVIASTLTQNSILSPGTDCLTVSDCNELYASLSADEQYAEQFQVGDTVYLRSVSDENRVHTAKITEIAPAASEVLSGTSVKTVLSLTASFTKKDGLRPGYNIYGYHFPQKTNHYLLVPLSAVFQEGETEYVYRYINGKIQKTKVCTDGILSQSIQITDGLSEKTLIVTDAAGLRDGISVRLQDQKGG